MSVQVKGSGTIGGLDEGLVVSGIVTSSTQINVGSNIKLGNAGVITATSFVGSGANLTSLPTQVTISSNADNRVITGGSGVNLTGESNLTFDGTTLSATGQLNLAGGIVLQPGGTAWSTTNNRPQIQRQADGELRLGAGSDSSSIVTFYTSPSAGGTLAERLRITSTGVIQTGSKTITGGNNLAIQNFAVKGIWSGSPSIGKEIELISGYDSNVKMTAIGYNLTDVNTGSTYGGDLVFHTQPSYSSPTSPIPERMRISSSGYITKSVVPSWNLRPSYSSTQTTSNTSSHHAIGWSADSSGGSTTSKATFLQNCTLHGSGFTYNLHNGQNYGKLKVPVAGRYYVNCTYRVENNPNQGNIYVYVNNTQIARQHVEMWAHRPYMHGQWASVLNLAANDTILISISCPNANVSGRNDNVNWFSGYLIG